MLAAVVPRQQPEDDVQLRDRMPCRLERRRARHDGVELFERQFPSIFRLFHVKQVLGQRQSVAPRHRLGGVGLLDACHGHLVLAAGKRQPPILEKRLRALAVRRRHRALQHRRGAVWVVAVQQQPAGQHVQLHVGFRLLGERQHGLGTFLRFALGRQRQAHLVRRVAVQHPHVAQLAQVAQTAVHLTQPQVQLRRAQQVRAVVRRDLQQPSGDFARLRVAFQRHKLFDRQAQQRLVVAHRLAPGRERRQRLVVLLGRRQQLRQPQDRPQVLGITLDNLRQQVAGRGKVRRLVLHLGAQEQQVQRLGIELAGLAQLLQRVLVAVDVQPEFHQRHFKSDRPHPRGFGRRQHLAGVIGALGRHEQPGEPHRAHLVGRLEVDRGLQRGDQLVPITALGRQPRLHELRRALVRRLFLRVGDVHRVAQQPVRAVQVARFQMRRCGQHACLGVVVGLGDDVRHQRQHLCARASAIRQVSLQDLEFVQICLVLGCQHHRGHPLAQRVQFR